MLAKQPSVEKYAPGQMGWSQCFHSQTAEDGGFGVNLASRTTNMRNLKRTKN